ncbi:UMP kinase [Candidatus Bathycorpusculum sp.]|uniref:UMP kinase n=1 Tax=Candidatus Bathycorpusculum sp. TaxID=2994959 RepID=UPI00282EC759|nr:UMP kinase [Candidatus Termitimicrobium sp.]
MVRIGGSVVANPINTQLLAKYADIIVLLKQQGHEVVVVVGGGALARQFIGFAKELELAMEAQDEVAISCSRLFAQLFLKKLDKYTGNKVSVTLEEAAEELTMGHIVVMGGLKPGITTDTVATLVAEKIAADMLLKGSDQQGVYNKDPRKHTDAVKLDHLSFEELSAVFDQNEHKAGIHQIIDPEAVKILKSNRIKTVVVSGFEPQNMLAAVRGENIGTIIS